MSVSSIFGVITSPNGSARMVVILSPKVTNPRLKEEMEAGSHNYIRRAVPVEDIDLLNSFLPKTEKFKYDCDQTVTFQRALDGSRWEARFHQEPQASAWNPAESKFYHAVYW